MNIPEGNPGVLISQNYQLIFFINHQASPPHVTLCLRGVRLQDWLQVSSRLASRTIETLFLTLDHSPHTSHLTPHLRDEQYLDTRQYFLDLPSFLLPDQTLSNCYISYS